MTYNYNSELSNDDYKLEDFIFWKRKEQFALLMENLVNNSIEIEKFQIGFSLLWWESIEENATFTKDPKRVKNFHLNLKSYGFCSMVTAILRQFEVLEDEECTEQEVKDYVQNTLWKIQPYL